MNSIERLKAVSDLGDLAKLLGFAPSGLSYVLYKLDSNKKYRTFSIGKKNGGSRIIKAPTPQLALLQSRLSTLLFQCVSEIQAKNQKYWHASHGFRKGRTIISNANEHRRKRFVFNIDIKDFFGAINFGRVRGFFIADDNFSLSPQVATLISQIACHDNSLPQGSPCSPIISNLIGNILDSRLLAIARDTKCSYTRYADDITFSTNEVLFPTEIAVRTDHHKWEVGGKLRKEIGDSGFLINEKKTRMSLRRSRQSVTGLVVNSKVNINRDYYRLARAMCNSVFNTGYYDRPTASGFERTDKLSYLDGILSHIYFVKARQDRHAKINKLAISASELKIYQAPVDIYKRFLFYRYFVSPDHPLIVTEGPSDIVYLQCAIRSLASSFPRLATEVDGKHVRLINFLRSSVIIRDVLNLGNGAAGQAGLIGQYSANLKKFKNTPMKFPVIILCDNDSGPKTVFKNAKSKCNIDIKIETTEPFYFLGENLYLIKVPEGVPAASREIEDLFSPAVLSKQIGTRSFDRKKEHGDTTVYGKIEFAEEIIRKLAHSIDFSGIGGILKRIDQCLIDYQSRVGASVSGGGSAGHVAAKSVPISP